jgi:O-antigen/teichoic acid export membrane protein
MSKLKIVKNISWLFIDKIIRILGSLFIGVWVARYLGPEDYGVYNYALSYSALFMILVKLGLDKIIIREIVQKEKLKNYYLGTAFILKLVGSFISIIGVFISLFFVNIDLTTKYVLLIISISFLFRTFDVIDFYYQSQVLSKYVVIARNSAFIIISLLKIYLILNEYSVVYFAGAYTLNIFFSALFLIIIYKINNNEISKWKFSNKIALKLLKDCWPLAISSFLISIYTRIDQVMIGNMLNSEQVGIYSVAVKLNDSWIFIPQIIINTLMPYFVDLRKNNKKFYEFRLLQLYSFMFWLGIFVGIFVIFFGRELIDILFGAEYIAAYGALVYNIWNGIFRSQSLSRGIWMISENLQRYRLYNNIMTVTLNITINLVLIPRYGITGAAIATLFTEGLGTWVFPFLWEPLRESTWMMIKSSNPFYLYKLGREMIIE